MGILNRILDETQELTEGVVDFATDKVNQRQFDALVSFVFNVGEGAFRISTLRKKLIATDYVGCADEFPKWNKQKGKVLAGLVKRRAMERELFLRGTEGNPWGFSTHTP